jgi:hypothetical protein
MSIISIMPIEAFIDDRLSKTDLRVLGAIVSYSNKKTGICWPKREQIAERCGLPLCKISTSTTRLVYLGWLSKEGDGGRSRSVSYRVLTPVLASKTVTDSVTVTKTETVTDSVTKTVTDSVRGIKQTNEQTNITSTGADEKKKKVTTKPKARITSDWQPGDRSIELIARAGISREFADVLVDEFILYWDERGEKRSGWEATFVNHAKTQWERKQKSQRDRAGSNAGFQNTRGNYDTNSKRNEINSRAGAKLSLVDKAQLAIERIEERERREQFAAERVIN